MIYLTFFFSLIEILPSFLLLYKSLRFRLRFSLTSTLVITVCYAAVLQLILQLVQQSDYMCGNWRIASSFLGLITAIAVNILIFRENPWKVVFAKLLVKSYFDCIDLITSGITEAFFKKSADKAVSVAFTFIFIVIMLSTIFLMDKLLKKLVLPLIEMPVEGQYWKYLWINPFLFYLLNRVAVSNRYMSEGAVSRNFSTIACVVWALAAFASYLVVLQMLTVSERAFGLQEKLRITDIQTDMQKRQYDLMSAQIERTQRAMHDLRHHALAMQGYARASDMKGIQEYLSGIVKATQGKSEILCENYAVNMIAKYYEERAMEKGIETNINIKLPKVLPIPESDFCVVLGNLLENAAEAAGASNKKENRFLNCVVTIADGNKIAVIIKNSYDGQIHSSGDTFLSTKHSGEGIGTASVCSVVHKYSGITRFKYGDGVFEASVFMSF
ncbi:MAG: GHKL domain-containing protein [Oscillospiraceae bacterium]